MKRNLCCWAFGLLFFQTLNMWGQDAPRTRTTTDPASSTAPQRTGLSLGTGALETQQSTSTTTVLSADGTETPQKGTHEEWKPPVESITVVPDSLRKTYEVEIFQNVLKMADLAKVSYVDLVEKAKAGDAAAIRKLLEFHKVVDGVDALNHAVTCLEILPLSGDVPFASAVNYCNPNLKKLILERTILAQGRTKKKYLRQSLTEWAPVSWAYLNGQTYDFGGGTAPDAEPSAAPAQLAPQPSTAPNKKQ